MTPRKIRQVFERLSNANPSPKGELDYQSPFQLLVAVVLSAQATDQSVNRATAQLFRDAPTAADMAALGPDGIEPYIKTIGLYRNKARHVAALANEIVATHGGKIPQARAALEGLPGVGRKTANVVLNIVFGEPTIAVDTHVFRVCNRTGLAPGHSPSEVESKLIECVPPRYKLHAHHWLILHGRYVCTARKPRCTLCGISDLCEFPEKS